MSSPSIYPGVFSLVKNSRQAILLTYLLRTNLPDEAEGYMTKTQVDWQNELCLSSLEFCHASRALIKKGLITATKTSNPSTWTIHLDKEAIELKIKAENSKTKPICNQKPMPNPIDISDATIVPNSWYYHIKRKKKADLISILLLSEIFSNCVEKKTDTLSVDYQHLSDRFGFTTKEVLDSLSYLESLDFLSLEQIKGMKSFIGTTLVTLDLSAVAKITYS